jgi:4a-hydroxytetrahydrobiopterin dehydratase
MPAFQEENNGKIVESHGDIQPLPTKEFMMSMKEKKCVPCEGGVRKLNQRVIDELLKDKDLAGWKENDEKLLKTFSFGTFVEAMQFVNRMADLAESEGHHPDFCVHYNQVDVAIWTHAIGGLSENDFILASKINLIP